MLAVIALHRQHMVDYWSLSLILSLSIMRHPHTHLLVDLRMSALVPKLLSVIVIPCYSSLQIQEEFMAGSSVPT